MWGAKPPTPPMNLPAHPPFWSLPVAPAYRNTHRSRNGGCRENGEALSPKVRLPCGERCENRGEVFSPKDASLSQGATAADGGWKESGR